MRAASLGLHGMWVCAADIWFHPMVLGRVAGHRRLGEVLECVESRISGSIREYQESRSGIYIREYQGSLISGSQVPLGTQGTSGISGSIRNQDQGWGYQVLSLISLIQHRAKTLLLL
jgi:hypothetical protein